MIEKTEIALIGALYDVETGQVEFLEETLMLGEIKHFYLARRNGAAKNAVAQESSRIMSGVCPK